MLQERTKRIVVMLAVTWHVLALLPLVNGNWPGWRGDGSGVTGDRGLALHWNGNVGVAWKLRIPGEGNGSPVVWGDRLFLTSSVEGGQTRLVICADVHSGEIYWQKSLASEQTRTYSRAGRAPATPVVDDQRVYVFFDVPGLMALTHAGEVVWREPLGPFTNPYNMASSPILVGDLVVMKCDHQGPSFIAAYARSDGSPRWRTERAGGLHYATPIAFRHDAGWQIVVNAEPIVSYDAASGDVLWSCHGMKHATTPSPLFSNGLVYATCGRNGPSMAIDPSGRGDVTDTHVRMHVASGGPYVPSPVMLGDFFMVPGDDGRVVLIDEQGRRILRHRVRGRFTASPIAAGNRIYWTDEKARTHVLELRQHDDPDTGVTHELWPVAINALEAEPCYASPAVSGGRYFIRTQKHLYCIVGGQSRLEPPPALDLSDDFETLRDLYRSEPVSEHDNTMLRLEIVEKLAEIRAPGVVDLLVEIINRDGHWDVTEAALRELGRHGAAAVPSLITMFERGQPFYKTVAAEHLAALAPPEAIAVLTLAAMRDQVQVRVASIEALGRIAVAHPDRAVGIVRTMLPLLEDSTGVVRLAAVRALKSGAGGLGTFRAAVVKAIEIVRHDANPLVAGEANIALETVFRETGR